MRVGIGYDVHRFEKGRKLVLGGVHIPFDKGLLGHSDSDVLIHAIIDALLGAMAKGDIGVIFPDSDEKYKDISSLELLYRLSEMLIDNNYKIGNIDSTIICQNPKLFMYFDQMRKNISDVLKIDVDYISIKATTTEGLGFEGEGKGIAANAIVCIENEEK